MKNDFTPNPYIKIWLKITNKTKYKAYKRQVLDYKIIKKFSEFSPCYQQFGYQDKSLSVVHSGNAGDIIYALPTVRELANITGKPVNFFLKINQPLILGSGYQHPLGNVMLNVEMANNIIVLLQNQPYINHVEIYDNQNIDLDLDNFRDSPLMLDRGNIARWYFYVTGIYTNLALPWISVEPNQDFKEHIVVARSSRYRNPIINYKFLEQYDKVSFVGVKSEYEDMRKTVKNIQYIEVNNFLDLAKIIKGCKFFIGNQSFPFSIAEGLKKERILETFYEAPNVIPEGENGYDIYFQQHFEMVVKMLNKAN